MHKPVTVVDRLERHQVVLYLGAIIAGFVLGASAPGPAENLAIAITPLLGALLYVTFLQVRFADLVDSVRDRRFLAAVLVLNFGVAPVVVAALSFALPADDAIRLGALLVLLCPCVDYVVVFTGLAGGDARRMLAATPLLLIVQMLLAPLYLAVLLGDGRSVIDPSPFVWAFLALIVLPLVLAWITQRWSRTSPVGRRVQDGASTAMVPLMMGVLVVAVSSQVPQVDSRFGDIAGVIPIYVAFLVVMALAGLAVTRVFRLAPASATAAVFSGATRNSLVVLPLALALPVGAELAAATVIAQTLVELIGMVVLVWGFTCAARRR
ncbi:arsenic resistance protein [Gordonia sp. 'Campus']|uniref:arsenic resistance protein n=1 Tax=Gordonia sp. 'Campus' TaxID=2915824 RepID=UPI001EE40056|nr:bile acid:sodium symporter [Gordonia sp. 'Campus']